MEQDERTKLLRVAVIAILETMLACDGLLSLLDLQDTCDIKGLISVALSKSIQNCGTFSLRAVESLTKIADYRVSLLSACERRVLDDYFGVLLDILHAQNSPLAVHFRQLLVHAARGLRNRISQIAMPEHLSYDRAPIDMPVSVTL